LILTVPGVRIPHSPQKSGLQVTVSHFSFLVPPKVPQKWAVFSLFGGVWRLEKIMLLLEIYLLCGNFEEIGLLMSLRVKIISIKQEALNTPCVCCMLVALSLNSGGELLM
jgi:hypothetical protein